MFIDLVEVEICHVNKGSCNIVSGSPSRYLTPMPSLTLIGLMEIDIYIFILLRDTTWPHDQR